MWPPPSYSVGTSPACITLESVNEHTRMHPGRLINVAIYLSSGVCQCVGSYQHVQGGRVGHPTPYHNLTFF